MTIPSEIQRIRTAMKRLWENRADVERRVPGFYADMRAIYLARLDALRTGEPRGTERYPLVDQAVESHR